MLHGWSTGGLVAALAAGMMPERSGHTAIGPDAAVALDVISRSPRVADVGTLAVAAGPPAARLLLRLAGRRILDAKRARSQIGAPSPVTGPAWSAETRAGSPTRRSTWPDGLDEARVHPERLGGTATAFASVIDAMFITQRPTNEALDSVRCPSWCCGVGTTRWSTPRRSCSTPGGRAGPPDPSTTSVTCFPSRRPTSARRPSAGGSGIRAAPHGPSRKMARATSGRRAAHPGVCPVILEKRDRRRPRTRNPRSRRRWLPTIRRAASRGLGAFAPPRTSSCARGRRR